MRHIAGFHPGWQSSADLFSVALEMESTSSLHGWGLFLAWDQTILPGLLDSTGRSVSKPEPPLPCNCGAKKIPLSFAQLVLRLSSTPSKKNKAPARE
jgi:hypothetical protein